MVPQLIFLLALTITGGSSVEPTVSSDGVFSFLNKWQTLAGAIIGGGIGVLGALIVAYNIRRREERSAGWLILYELMSVLAARAQVEKAFAEAGIAEDQKADWVARRLRETRPHLPSAFETSTVVVMSVDEQLWTQLNIFRDIYGQIESMMDELDEAQKTGKPVFSAAETLRKHDLIYKGFTWACDNAEFATDVLQKLVTGNTVIFHRIVRRLKLVTPDQSALKVIRRGSLK